MFKKIDTASDTSITSALDLFSTPPTSVAIANSNYREYLTLNPITTTPFHFKIHPVTSYIDLSKCYILAEFQIQKVDEKGVLQNVGKDEVVSTIQMPGSTFIKNMVVSINGREVFNANQLYSYKTYFDTELSYPTEVKENFLSTSAYYPDTIQDNVSSSGFINRKNTFAESKIVQTITNLDADIFNQV